MNNQQANQTNQPELLNFWFDENAIDPYVGECTAMINGKEVQCTSYCENFKGFRPSADHSGKYLGKGYLNKIDGKAV